MTRKEKVQKLIETLRDLEESQQYTDYLEGQIRSQLRTLKLTKKDYKIADEEGYELEEWLDDLGI